MKKLFLLSIFTFVCFYVQAQKHDFKWLMGSQGNHKIDWSITVMDFDTPDGNPSFYHDSSKQISFSETTTNICTPDGRYLFSYNGRVMEDSSNRMTLLMIDSIQTFVPPISCLILPYPGYDKKFIIFYQNQNQTGSLTYSVIEYSDKYPNGKVTLKNQRLIWYDSLQWGGLSAVKHANGRDWWIIATQNSYYGYYKYLLSPIGVRYATNPTTQVFGGERVPGQIGQTAFSNDGKYFANACSSADFRGILYNNIFFYTFDRCSGLLDNMQWIRFKWHEITDMTGCAFSPDSKLLYVSTIDSIYQFRIVGDSLADRQTIAGYVPAPELIIPPSCYASMPFGMLQQAPDGRIYGSTAGSSQATKAINVINYPNLIGKACGFEQVGRKSLTFKAGLPNFPYFRLGALEGSGCDTLPNVDKCPLAHWRYNGDTLDYLNFDFTDLSSLNATEWSWYFDDPQSGTQNTSTKQSPNHRFSQNGIYNVCLIVKNKYCADTLCRTIKIGNIVSTKNQKVEVEINISPNPCEDFLIVNVLDYNPEKMILILHNQLGQNVLTQKLYQGSNLLQTKDFPSGMYFISLFEKGFLIKKETLVKK